MYSKIFNCECKEIDFKTFRLQFLFQMSEIISPEIAEKFLLNPISIYTISMSDIAPKLLSCFTVEEMHTVFMSLTDEEQYRVITSIELWDIDFIPVSEGATVLVPELPKNYIKPFLLGLLTPSNILQ